ncbi:MAG: hypothetical protein NVSMB64_11660 [Candidatus Velthaea sp.]
MAAKKKWSQNVTETSDAMDIAGGTFQQRDPKKIAEAVEHDAEVSKRRKSSPYRSAMSMLTFYINRAGSNLSAEQRKVLDTAKEILRAEFGPDAKAAKTKTPSKSATRKRKEPAASSAPKRKKATASGAPKRKKEGHDEP